MSSTCLVCERIFSRTIELAKDTVVVMKKEEKNTADKNRSKTKIQKKKSCRKQYVTWYINYALSHKRTFREKKRLKQ